MSQGRVKEYSKEQLQKGLDCYDPERRVFPKIAKRQQLSKRDILFILKWKLTRIKDSNSETIADDNMAKINQAARDAGSTDSERQIEALENLGKIPGIGLAVATVILTLCYPDKFTVIDERVLTMLNLFPSSLPANKRNRYSTYDWTAADYVNEYLPKVKESSRLWRCTLRNADRALWGLSVSQKIDEMIAKS